MEIPFGICQCGKCGRQTRIPTKNNAFHGHVKGVPLKYCKGHSPHARSYPRTPKREIADFWAKVDKRGPNECWPWTACVSSFGHGNVQFGGKVRSAHIVAWTLTYGPLTTEKPCVLHRCDNPPCCNPNHLFDGTKRDNSHDMVAKSRHGMAILSAENVIEALRLHRSGRRTIQIAGLLGVSRATIADIINGRSWTDITGL